MSQSRINFKDSKGIEGIIDILQKELRDIAEEAYEFEEAHYDDYIDGKYPKRKYEETSDSQGAKSTAIYYLLKAYGVKPNIDQGMLGLYDLSYLKNL